ncbi:SCO3242 family prenyltransferase [Streptomyces sp. NPDC059002]|uniref:SCO3242 family prenyltransferase n=1 Tax=Streptomyces sp. NPDC059002 TaxID=3346690 RepID=UPI0036AFDD99
MSTPRDWAELLRLPALFTVPGDALAGAAATGLRPNHRTLIAIASSLCLYEAGMALNDWADRADDAVERPERPLPSGRITPPAALAAATALTATGLALASRAGRPSLTTATALATTVWAYDLHLKHTPAGPTAMAAARGLDLVLGAVATGGAGAGAGAGGRGRLGGAGASVAGASGVASSGVVPSAVASSGVVPSAVVLAAHTLAVTTVSRREAQGGSTAAPLAALAAAAVLAERVGRGPVTGRAANRRAAVAAALGLPGTTPTAPVTARSTALRTLRGALAVAYVGTVAKPFFHAVLNPSPPLTQRAVGGGIRAMIPLQAALSARAGAAGTALLTAALAPAARKFARKVSVT